MRRIYGIVIASILLIAMCSCGKKEEVIKVPDVVGMQYEEGKTLLDEKKMVNSVEYVWPKEEHEKNTIVSQSVSANEVYKDGTEIKLSVCSGRTFEMPDLVEKKFDDSNLEFNFNVSTEYTHEYDEGIVISASKNPGEEFKDDETIDIKVSAGKYTSVEGAKGLSFDEAMEYLRSIGVSKIVKEENFNSINDKGIVYDVSPKEIGDLNNEEVKILVSKGKGITVPTVTSYESIKDAKKELEKVGCKVTVKYAYSNMDADTMDGNEKITKQDKQGTYEKAPDVTLTVNKAAVTISSIRLDLNYVGGVDTYITFKNKSDKQIAYVDFTVTYYDRMGNKASNEIGGGSSKILSYTGPLNGGKTANRIYWDAPFYNSSVAAICPEKAEVTFADGTKQVITFSGWYWYTGEYYGGDLHN